VEILYLFSLKKKRLQRIAGIAPKTNERQKYKFMTLKDTKYLLEFIRHT
jgi:hypothetical protein